MSTGSEKIRARSKRRFLNAIERLRNSEGSHPQHVGKTVAIRIAAVAREARMGRTTLHRFPVCAQIRALSADSPLRERTKRSSTERANAAAKREIAELKRQVRKLLEQNLTLTMRLARYEDPSTTAVVAIAPRKAKA